MTTEQQVEIKTYDELTTLVNETLSDAMDIPVSDLRPDYLLSKRDEIPTPTSRDADYLDFELRLSGALGVELPTDTYAQRLARTPFMITYGISHLLNQQGRPLEGAPKIQLTIDQTGPLSLNVKLSELILKPSSNGKSDPSEIAESRDRRLFSYDPGSQTIMQSTSGYNPQKDVGSFENIALEDVSGMVDKRGNEWLRNRLYFQAASTYKAIGLVLPKLE